MRFKIFFENDGDMVQRALEFAKEKHRRQTRRSGLPYIIHPEMVAELVKKYIPNYTDDMVASAILHDTLEDTKTTYQELVDNFGKTVADIVMELTTNEKDKLESGGKKYYLTGKMNKMSDKAFTIKLLDRLHNITDIADQDPAWRTKYKTETEYIFDHLSRKLTAIDKSIIKKIRDMMSGY
jgi:GTP diphosphokinase / guanosine-3',5'-bis(diphosphate) 3'-diphosphatase